MLKMITKLNIGRFVIVFKLNEMFYQFYNPDVEIICFNFPYFLYLKNRLVRRQPRPLNQDYIARVDEIFRNRWRTLLSVDDMVDNIMTFLHENDMLENTVAMFTSDHGYHLGTFGLPLDKRMPYETDIRYLHYYRICI